MTLVGVENDALVDTLADRLEKVVVETLSQGQSKEKTDATWPHINKQQMQGACQHTGQQFKRSEHRDTREYINRGIGLV